jgi:hypothetical protein
VGVAAPVLDRSGEAAPHGHDLGPEPGRTDRSWGFPVGFMNVPLAARLR